MSTNRTDLVGEYLREVELRLAGLPLLQRRELLADLEAHISEAREHAASEGELIEVLERLGSPEAIAAAAYAEAGAPNLAAGPPPPPPRPQPMLVGPPLRGRNRVPGWLIGVAVAVVVLVVFGCLGSFFVARSAGSEPAPSVVPAEPMVPGEPAPARTVE